MTKHTVQDEFTGLTLSFELSNVRIEEIEGANAVLFTLKTDAGEMSDVCEWVSVDEYDEDRSYIGEKTDSHIETNQIDELYSLFPQLHELPQPVSDITPYELIVDEALGVINNAKKS